MRLTASLIALTLAAPALAQSGDERHEWGERNTSFQPVFDAQFRAPIEVSDVDLEQQTIASGLVHPWAVEALPGDAGYLVTERAGRLRHVSEDGTLSEPIEGIPEVLARQQGGLLDVKAGPDFADDRMIYLTYSKPMGDGMSATAAGRGRLSEDMTSIEGFEDIFVQEPPSPTPMHYGSRIVFEGQGRAFVTTGEHFTDEQRDMAQDLDNHYGKVVRVGLDGSVPQDNPFTGQEGALDEIWSYGHRNIQGAAMRDGQLWIVEHGPAGGDEINLPEPGANYGWPVVSYGERYESNGGGPVGIGEARAEGMEQPLYWWDPVIGPGDMTFYDGAAFEAWQGDALIGGLVSGGLVRLSIGQDGLIEAEERLVPEVGRTRDVEVDQDGTLLILTDFEDGALIRLSPAG